MKRHLPLTRRQLITCWILLAALILHIASLCLFVRYYARSFVFDFGKGFVTLYWGGQEKGRNTCIFNVSEWPMRPETVYAGEDWPDGLRWETYGMNCMLAPSELADRIHIRGILGTFGYSLPHLRRYDDEASFCIPVGIIALIIEAGMLYFLLRGWQFNKSKI
jgi:hypothetical protein